MAKWDGWLEWPPVDEVIGLVNSRCRPKNVKYCLLVNKVPLIKPKKSQTILKHYNNKTTFIFIYLKYIKVHSWKECTF